MKTEILIKLMKLQNLVSSQYDSIKKFYFLDVHSHIKKNQMIKLEELDENMPHLTQTM